VLHQHHTHKQTFTLLALYISVAVYCVNQWC